MMALVRFSFGLVLIFYFDLDLILAVLSFVSFFPQLGGLFFFIIFLLAFFLSLFSLYFCFRSAGWGGM